MHVYHNVKLFVTVIECGTFSPSPSLPPRIWKWSWRKAGQWKTTFRTMSKTFVKVSLWKWNCTSEVIEYGAFLQVDSKLNSENMRVIIVIFLLIMWICQAHFII